MGWGVINTYRILKKRLIHKLFLGCQRREKCPILKFKLLNLDMDMYIGLNWLKLLCKYGLSAGYIFENRMLCVLVFPQYLQLAPRVFVSVITKQANESLFLHSGVTCSEFMLELKTVCY